MKTSIIYTKKNDREERKKGRRRDIERKYIEVKGIERVKGRVKSS